MAIGRAVILPYNSLVNFAEQYPGLEQVGGDLPEQEVRWNHRADRLLGGATYGVVDDAQLRAELARGARAVNRAQRMLPEASTNRQQWVVLDQNRLVLATGSDPGTHQLAIEFPSVGFQRRFDVADAVRALRQNDPPGDHFDVVVREFDIDREPALETLKRRRAGECGLPGAQEEQAITKPFAARLNDLLNHIGTAGVIADILLHLVEDDDGARHVAVGRQRIL